MEEKVIDLQEARKRLEETMPEVYRTLNNWSLEPKWERAAQDWTTALSEYLNREAMYRGLLEQTVMDLQERVARLEERAPRRNEVR
jgi:sugar (pentulose or hexulose) kinase